MRHRLPMHWLPMIVMVLAAVGLVFAFAVLAVNPFGLVMPERAQVATAFATLFTVAAGIVAIAAASWFGSSDFRAQQAVKEDTARLLATLRSIRLKADALGGGMRGAATGLGFDSERKALNSFLSSTTGFAYWSWCSHEGVRPEWKESFFFNITLLLQKNKNKDERLRMRNLALRLETLVSSLSAHDVRAISSILQDLPEAIAKFRDTAGREFIQRSTEQAKGRDLIQRSAEPVNEAETNFRKFQHLRKKGVNDPDVRLFEAVLEPGPETRERIEQVRAALADGADVHITDLEVLAKYEAELADFQPGG